MVAVVRYCDVFVWRSLALRAYMDMIGCRCCMDCGFSL